MKPFDVLTETEKSTIIDYIKMFGPISGNRSHRGDMAPLPTILDYWNRKKGEEGFLFKMFGEKLIHEQDITFEKDINELQRDITNAIYDTNSELKPFIDEVERELGPKFMEPYSYYIGGHEYRGKHYNAVFHTITDLTSGYYLAKNSYDGNDFEIPVPNDGKPIKVKKGMKTIRILSKIADAYNLNHFERFRIAHSMILNDKKLSGKLCLSIHPLDYMTMSDNDNGWQSCMNWQNIGDYRAGTVEMLNSHCVVVAYLKSSNDMEWYGCDCNSHTWNSKKWRCLFVVNKDVIFHVRPYPYHNINLVDKCLELLKELAEKNLGYKYGDEVIKFNSWNPIEVYGKEVTIKPATNFMYNDCGNGQRAYFNPDIVGGNYTINYSGCWSCMWCGSDDDSDIHNEMVFCSECEDICFCCECGERLDRYDAIEHNGSYYCEYCYDGLFVNDDITNKTIYEDESIKISLLKEKPAGANALDWHSLGTIITAKCNLNTKVWFKYFTSTEHSWINQWGNTRYYITVNECTDKGLEIFGFDSKEEAMQAEAWN